MPCFCHGWCPVCTSFPGATLASAAHDACRPFGRPPLSLERPSCQFCSSSASPPPGKMRRYSRSTPASAEFGHSRVGFSNKVRRCCCWRRRKGSQGRKKARPGRRKDPTTSTSLSLCHVLSTLLQQAINNNTAPSLTLVTSLYLQVSTFFNQSSHSGDPLVPNSFSSSCGSIHTATPPAPEKSWRTSPLSS